jgi:hypothetical protein
MAGYQPKPTDLRKFIKCAVCDAPVEEAFAEEFYYDDTIHYKVRCHGDVDNCVLPRSFFDDFSVNDITEIVAFRTKRIEHEKLVTPVQVIRVPQLAQIKRLANPADEG